jgi:hypothetical protein
LDEALARIPVHNPEWTNFNRSDPGVTLIEVFAFLAENILYRSNQIPERNRLKFLSLLGVPLQPATTARGLVTFANERGPLQTFTLNAGLEVRAGQVPFRTEMGLDVLPIEAQVYYKRRLENPPDKVKDYYGQLYASYAGPQQDASKFQYYQTVPLTARESEEVDLGSETVDGSLWVALMVRAGDKPYASWIKDAREAIAGKTLSLGVVPSLANASRKLAPGGRADSQGRRLLQFWMPTVGPEATLERDGAGTPTPRYQSLDASSTTDMLDEPSVVQLVLPQASQLRLWEDIDPLEAGVGDLPPALEDTNLSERVITWLCIRASAAMRAGILWVGINAARFWSPQP